MTQLAGIAEIADLLGLSRQRVTQLAKTEGFPEPIQRLRMGPVWNLADIQQWMSKR